MSVFRIQGTKREKQLNSNDITFEILSEGLKIDGKTYTFTVTNDVYNKVIALHPHKPGEAFNTARHFNMK